jgi:Spy/CpxP family protein refolding chaperone
MKQTQGSRLACWATAIMLAVAFSTAERPVWGAEGKAPAKKLLGKKGRRLPAHYTSVVNEKQRDEIYKIQEEYQPKIDALESELKALREERDEKISAVLTPEQKKQVEEAAVKAKRKPKDTKPAKDTQPAKEGPAIPPAEPAPAK